MIPLLIASTANAQGIQDRIGLGLVPPTSVATVNEASALLINPAAIGFITGPDLMVLHSSSWATGRSDVDSAMAAVTLLDTLGLGAALEIARPAGATTPTAGNAFVRATLGYALRLDDTVSLGGSYRILSAQATGLSGVQMWDAGITLRPFRFLSAGLVVENLVPPETPSGPLVPRAYRLGVAVRPDAEWATLALEVRIDETLRMNPALLLQVEPLPGVIASVQLATDDVITGFDATTLGVGLEINHSVLGAGASGAASLTQGQGGMTAYARASLAARPSLLPRFSRVVVIEPAGDLRPMPPDNPWDAATYSSNDLPGEIALALERAVRDPAVRAVLLRIRPLSAGMARIEALRRRLAALSDAGKKVFIYSDRLGNREYLLASAADVIIVPPSAEVSVDGIGLTMEYFAGTLELLGVQAHAVTSGPFKSAPETFTRTGPSPEAREASTRLVDVITDTLITSIASARGLAPADVETVMERGQLTAVEARSAGLVDRVAYADEIDPIIEEELGATPFLDEDYLRPLVQRSHWARLPTVGVIPIVDSITMGRSSRGLFGMEGSSGVEDVVSAIEAAVEDDDIRALVLRIDSPGGDALASDLIWRAVEQARRKKPVVASFGDVAASGGYYVACGASKIFAEGTTITGSIGVFSLLFSAEELLDNLGVKVFEDRRHALSNTGAFHRAPTPEELDAMQRSVGNAYDLFKRRVATGRNLSPDEVEAVAQGRVWSGRDALDRRLIDALGGLNEAIAEARRLAKLDPSQDIEVTVLRDGGDPISRWRSTVEGVRTAAAPDTAATEGWATLWRRFGAPARWMQFGAHPLAMLPYRLVYR